MTARINNSFAIFAAVLVATIVCFAAGTTALASPYSDAVLADNPLAYWRLGDAGPTAVDATGNGHDGTASGPAVNFGVPGVIVGDPTNNQINTPGGAGVDRIVVPGFEKFPVGSTGYSAEYWLTVNEPVAGSFRNILGDGESGGDFYMMNYLTNAGRIRPHFNGAGAVSTDSNLVLTQGQTYHIVTTWDQGSGNSDIWITPSTDAVASLDKSVFIGMGNPVNTDNQMFIGRDNREPGGNFLIDEAAFYNYALSPTQIQAHFAAASDFGGSAVPEPSTFVLGMLAMLALGAFAWRRR